jgi:hypothetical protein
VGAIVGASILGIFVNYIISRAISGESTDGIFLGSSVDQVREGIAKVDEEKKVTSVYGKVVSIGSGTLVLEVQQIEGPKQFTFIYGDDTKIFTLANDAASSEIPLSSDEIQVGDHLTVTSNEAVGSVQDQHAIKIVKL